MKTPVSNGANSATDSTVAQAAPGPAAAAIPEPAHPANVEAAAAGVNRDHQLRRLLDHFELTVAQVAEMLDCSPNSISYRLARATANRSTNLDDRIDAVHYVASALEADDFPTASIRDWLFSRSPYFAGKFPATRFPHGDEEIVLEAGRCYLAGYSAPDFAAHLEHLGLVPAGADDDGRRVLPFRKPGVS